MHNNKIILISFICLILAQVSKLFINVLMNRKLDISYIYTTGGMPSSHSAFVTCLAFSIYLFYGKTSIAFPVAVALAIIVIHDSMGIRLEASKHAKILNSLIKELSEDQLKTINLEKELKETLGHMPREVLMGIIFGLSVAFLGFYLVK